MNAGGASMADGLTHHLVWACGAGYGQLYLDGIPTGSPVALPGGTMTLEDTSVGGDTRAVMWLSGSSLIARIYPFALTATQVTANYAAGANL